MGKSFLFVIILTAFVLADNTDIQLQTSTQFVKSDSTETITKVEITNLPQRDFWDKYGVIVTGIGGVLIGWLLSFISQKKLIKQQITLKKNDDWINNFRNTIVKLTTIFDNYYKRITPREGHKEDFFKKRPSDNELLIYKEEMEYYNNLLMLYLSNETLSTKDDIVDITANIIARLNNEYDLKEIPQMINNCLALGNGIIKSKEKQE